MYIYNRFNDPWVLALSRVTFTFNWNLLKNLGAIRMNDFEEYIVNVDSNTVPSGILR